MRIPPLMMILAATPQTIKVSNDVMADSIIAAINGVHHSCLVNTNMMEQYTGGVLPTTQVNGKPVLLTFASINGAQLKILTDSTMTPKIDAANFGRAAEVVLQTLQFSVPATAQAMMDKKDELTEAGLINVAANSLEILMANHVAAGVAIGPKVDHSNQTLADALHKEVLDVTEALDDAVKFFKSS